MTKLLFLVIFVYMTKLIDFWKTLPSHMDPIIFKIGNFPIQWYGLMYLVGFVVSYLIMSRHRKNYLAKYPNHKSIFDISQDSFHKNVATPIFLGIFLGGRLGYVLFYNFSYYLSRPLEIFLPFNSQGQFSGISGMSFHGGLVGVIIAWMIYCHKNNKPFLDTLEFYLPAVPLGYTFGRIGNFINGELYGRFTDSPIGMIFSRTDNSGLLRHPSQLYEAFFEGIICFIILWFLKTKVQKKGSLLAIYIFCYGFFRFGIEYFRQPDSQFKDAHDNLGLVFLSLTMGQILCLVMMLTGLTILYLFRNSSSIIYPKQIPSRSHFTDK